MQVDNAPIKQAQKDIDRLNGSVDRMAKTFLGIYGIGRLAGGFMSVIQGASDTIETMNVLNQTFKSNSSEVVAWSKTVGKTMGRSQYDLQKTAGQFGAFLSPQGFEGSQLASMSEQLTALSVDLASFYNISDSEAQTRLFSGMAGETEAVRRLGIDISEMSLKNIAQQQGKNYKNLTLREKSEMRLAKILQDTTDKQGDAIRTYDEWENTFKRFQGQIKDVSVELGKNMIPTAKAVVKELSSWLPVVHRLASESTALSSGFELVATAAGGLALAYAAQNYMMSAGIVAAGGLFLLFDEIRAGMSDGPSDTVLGDFGENILGIDDPAKKAAEGMQEYGGALDIVTSAAWDFANVFHELPTLLYQAIFGSEADMQAAAAKLGSSTKGALDRRGQNEVVQQAAEASKMEARGRAAGSGDINSFRRTYAGEQITNEQLAQEFMGLRAGDMRGRFASGEMVIPTAEDVTGGIAANAWGYAGQVNSTGSVSAGQPTVPGQETGSLDNSTVININGGNVQEVRKVVEDVMDAKNRRMQAVMSRMGQAPYTGAAF